MRAALAVFGLLIVGGVSLQARWNGQCAAAQHGTRWDADAWACVS